MKGRSTERAKVILNGDISSDQINFSRKAIHANLLAEKKQPRRVFEFPPTFPPIKEEFK